MRNAATTVKSSLIRLYRWLYLRAIALGLALVLATCWVVGNPPEAQGSGLASATRPLRLGSGQFGGLTSKGWPVVLRLSPRGDRVRRAVAGVEFTCTAGGGFAIKDTWTNLPIRKRRFGATSTGSDSEAGTVYDYKDSISGQMNRKGTRITGTWQSVMVQRNAFGAVLDTCDTGPLRFTAIR